MKVTSRLLSFGFLVLGFFLLLCVSAQPAYGYVDPGSGLLIYQVTGSLFTGILFLSRRTIRQLFHILTGKKNKDEDMRRFDPSVPRAEKAGAGK